LFGINTGIKQIIQLNIVLVFTHYLEPNIFII